MMLRKLTISNFRGIRSCDWSIDRRLSALVGPGDSTKTTLLDAIGLVLSPNYSLQFTDADFFNFDTSMPLTIEAVITELPDSLVQESQLGKDRSGLQKDGTLVHDPLDGTEECLIIRLTVSADLEPTWEVARPGDVDSRPISASQRRQLGFFRVGERTDLHLRWARGSALSGLTEATEGASAVILDAQRQARQAVFAAEPSALHVAARTAQLSASKLGTAPFVNLRPGLEPGSVASTHALILHDGDVPLSSFGLGTRRLTSLSIQDEAVRGGSIIAIDELEYGLEPHRLSHVSRHLKQRTKNQQLQVIFTTHAPTTVETLAAEDLIVVRADSGITTCIPVPPDLDNAQGAFRSAPSALLGRRVMVGEGATEVGFIRGLITYWDAQRLEGGEQPLASAIGTVVVNGSGGTQPLQRASTFHQLGYPTLLLMDNDDRSVDSKVTAASAAGVQVEQWMRGRALEDEVVQGLQPPSLAALVALAIEFKGEESVRASVESRVGQKLSGTDPAIWKIEASLDDATLRAAIAGAAKARGWFKREDAGEALANLATANLPIMMSTELARVLARVKKFAYNEDPQEISGEPKAPDD